MYCIYYILYKYIYNIIMILYKSYNIDFTYNIENV